MKLARYMETWLECRALVVRRRTLEQYQDITARYIVPALGEIKVSRLAPSDVSALLTRISAEGHTRTAELTYVVLKAALRERAPAALRGVPRPAHIQHTPEPWSDAQMSAYLAGLVGHPHRLALSLALLMGLRRGEICGLRWGDIDLAEGQLTVRNQRQRLADGQIVDCPPKSATSVRVIPIPAPLLELMRAEARPSGYVCGLTPSGLSAAHRALVAALGLPPIPLHGLRHSMATACIRHGGDMRCLQSILGHSSYTVTANRYTHPDGDMLRAALDAVGGCVV